MHESNQLKTNQFQSNVYTIMKRIIPFFFISLFAGGVFADVGTVTVTVLSSEPVTGITEIDYEFTENAYVYDISAEVSFDNGNSFESIPDADLKGALTNVAPGGPYSLIWDGGASFPETFSDETVIKIEATATTFTCGEDLTFTYNGQEVTYGTVLIDYGGDIGERCWLDRNLGANQVATSSTDEEAYGDLFQWGRGDDGHQDRTSSTTNTSSNTDVPGHGDFITVEFITENAPYDWRSSRNNALWQGVEGINNPCPPGWRVPVRDELNAERLSWSAGAAGPIDSDLKWPLAGYRSFSNGSLQSVGTWGTVWSSSSVDSDGRSRGLTFYGSYRAIGTFFRAEGRSVRCIKD